MTEHQTMGRNQFWLALTTEADQARAEALARRLLNEGLVACVSLQPLQSLYSWQGRLERGQEVQMLLKTDGSRLAQLETVVHQQHSYDTPQWLAWPVQASAGYAAWMTAVLSPDAELPKP